jgi:hypothetical protein
MDKALRADKKTRMTQQGVADTLCSFSPAVDRRASGGSRLVVAAAARLEQEPLHVVAHHLVRHGREGV